MLEVGVGGFGGWRVWYLKQLRFHVPEGPWLEEKVACVTRRQPRLKVPDAQDPA